MWASSGARARKKKKERTLRVDARLKRACEEKMRIYKRTKTNPKTKMCDLNKDLQKKIRIFLQNMAPAKKIPALIICRENALMLHNPNTYRALHSATVLCYLCLRILSQTQGESLQTAAAILV
jgi:hypothetical protein